jgi:hypothetical protein
VGPLLWSTFEVDAYQPILGPFREECHSRGLGHLESNFLIGIVNDFELFLVRTGIASILRQEALELTVGSGVVE